MRSAEEHARRAGEPELRLGVRVALPGNLAFYERLGYREVARHVRPDGTTFWIELAKGLSQAT